MVSGAKRLTVVTECSSQEDFTMRHAAKKGGTFEHMSSTLHTGRPCSSSLVAVSSCSFQALR